MAVAVLHQMLLPWQVNGSLLAIDPRGGPGQGREVLRFQRFAVAENDRALDGIAELPHAAGPGVLLKQLRRV